MLLIFDMHVQNSTLFLKASFLFLVLALSGTITVILRFAIVYESLQLQKSDLSQQNIIYLINHLFQSIFLSETLIQLNHLIT